MILSCIPLVSDLKWSVSSCERRKEGRKGKGEEKESNPHLADKQVGLQELKRPVYSHTPD